ncbi:unnamed protein product [Clavelina lepadiformis]|uniref:Mediator of RNA polymerase II transcription subunit 9 n=1 Tax=Clavelina lepadiformis TaxID=159417 RepID=A0ABP0GUX5_CLALP
MFSRVTHHNETHVRANRAAGVKNVQRDIVCSPDMNNSGKDKEKKPFDLCFLSDIYEILSRLEAGGDIESLTHKVLELKEKINQAKLEIQQAEGIDNTLDEQQSILKALQEQLKIKIGIVQKYENFQTHLDH